MDVAGFMERYEKILKERNIPKKDFYAACGFTDAAASQWRHRKNAPSMKTIERIAEYLNVSTEYLLTGWQEENKTPAPGEGSGQAQPMNDMERHLIQIARDLDPYRQALLLWMAEAVANKDDPRTPQVFAGVPGLYAETARAEGRSSP